MWDIYWIRTATCITRVPWGDPVSISLHRTLSRPRNTQTFRDTTMCPTWRRTHSLRGTGDHRMARRGRTGARTAWDHLTLFQRRWTTRPRDRSLTARLSTTTCTPRAQPCYNRHQRTLTMRNFHPKGAIRTNGWVKLCNRLPLVSLRQSSVLTCYVMLDVWGVAFRLE